MGVKTISGPQRKFCEGIIKGLSNTEAYLKAYPKSSAEAARRSASDLLTKPDIQACIAELREKADNRPGSAVLTRAQKRDFLARLVMARVGELPPDSDLWNSIKTTDQGIEYKLPDKLNAIKLDNDLAGEGSEAEGQDALTKLLERVMK